MIKKKKFVSSILVFTMVIYFLLGIFINNNIYANTERKRETNLEGLSEEKYPVVATLINELKSAHPNWTFTILYTGLDWSTVIYNETEALHGRSLVQTTSLPWLCSTCGLTAYDNGSWHCASKSTVSYYMDVRNWLTEKYIFAFETLSYDESTQTIEGVQRILKGTFMDKETITYIDTEGNEQIIEKSYAQIIMEAAKEAGVSPYHLASRVKQEQGDGTSGLVNGKYEYTDSEGEVNTEFRGHYNYFNIKAAGGNSATIIKNGLTHAKKEGWTTPELSIKGGATFLAEEYISNYQDCLYLEKYQVDSAGGLYYHQYMQNVSAPYSEGYSTYVAYRDLEMLDCSFNFVIPVYENMPDIISPSPDAEEIDIVTENVQVTTAYSALKIRNIASSSGTTIASANKGTILLRIEKATKISEDGRYWDKVVYDKGNEIIIGYAARTDTDGSQYLTLVDDVVTVNEETETTEGVNLRNGPGTSSTTIKQTLPAGTKLTIIDKMEYELNNYYWYRIKLEDGTQGYIASEFLKGNEEEPEVPDIPVEPEEPDMPNEPENPDIPIEPETPDTPTIPEEPELPEINVVPENCKIEENNLIIAPGTTIEDLEGVTNNSENFATGASVTLNQKNYSLVILADANSDGTINSADLLKIVKHLNETAIIEGAGLRAADCNNDGIINSADLLKIVKYLNETGSITL